MQIDDHVITAFGAHDGQQPRAVTTAVQAAIDAAGAAGGGRVVIPPGEWRCGSIRMRSHVELHLSRGARLLAELDQDLVASLAGNTDDSLSAGRLAMVIGDGVEDIAITGAGTIDGNGNSRFWGDDVLTPAAAFRPVLVLLRGCRNVLIRDVRLHYSMMWTCHLEHCDDVLIDAIDIRTHPERINADGIDPDGCTNVRIRGCTIDSTDDAVCLKSTTGRPCQDIIVSDCVLTSRCAALKLGTESHGPIRRVLMHHCLVRGSNMGLAFYQKDGAVYEDISVMDCTFECTGVFPVFIDNTPRFASTPTQGEIRRLLLADLRVTGPGRFYLRGMPNAPITDVSIRHLRWTITAGGPAFAESAAPDGARRVERDPTRTDDAAEPYQLLFAHCRDIRVVDALLEEAQPGAAGPRGVTLVRDGAGVSLDAISRVSEALSPAHATPAALP